MRGTGWTFVTGGEDGKLRKGGKFMADLKECDTCGYHFPTEYAHRVHICEKGNPESDNKMLIYLREAKEGKDGRDPPTHS